MIQELLVVITTVGAAVFLVVHIIRLNKAKDDKCQGCAVNKIYNMKLEKSKAKH